MKRRKMIWNRLLGTLLILAFGFCAFEYFILNNKVLWKEKGSIAVKDLPSDLRSRFAKLQELYGGDERFDDMVQNYSKYPEDLLELAAHNKDTFIYVYRYPVRKKIVLEEPLHESLKELPILYQWDERWGYATYGDGLMGLTGCGPAVLSMVLSYLTKDPVITPLQIARYSKKHGLYMGSGNSGDFFHSYSNAVSVHCIDLLPTENQLRESMMKGPPITVSMDPGDFTTAGHLIVLVGIDRAGKLILHDPDSLTRTKKSRDLCRAASQMAAAWGFTKE